MPITYNGIGTRYSGHREAIAREGHCASCHRLATLTSYETTLFFVVLFIPVVPLGKKRIIDQCSACRRHYVMPLQAYLDGRATDYAQADKLLAEATEDAHAIAAVRLVLNYREPVAIDRLVAAAETKFPDSATLLLFTAETRRVMSQYRAAEESTARSLALREDPDVRENLAILQFARGDVDAGRATLEPLFAIPTRVPAAAVGAGVEALQRLGRHREAMELMSRVPIDGAPADVVRRFAALRATSERTLERSLVDPDKFEVADGGAVVRRKRVRFARLRWVAAGVGALAFVYAAYSVFLGASRRAYLVNGTERPYTATVDGRAYALAPHEVKPIRVGEGDIAMSISAPGYVGRPSTFHFATSPLTRPFDGDVLVLDPDGVADVVTGEIVYAARNSHAKAADDVIHTGSVGHVLHGIDYAFAEPPKSKTLANQLESLRNGVAYLDKRPMSRLLDGLNDDHDPRARQVALGVLAWPVLDEAEAAIALRALDRDEAIAALKPRVALRPIELNAHRAYQNLREDAGESTTLSDEYRALLDADPENGTLLYLLGRTLNEAPGDSLALFRRALAAPVPEPMAWVGEAYVLTARGDFEGALAATRRARLAMPTREATAQDEWELLLATGRGADALAALGEPPELERYFDFRRRLETLFAVGRSGEVDALLARRAAAAAKRWGEPDATIDARVMRATVAYFRHDEAGYGDIGSIPELSELRFAAETSRRDCAAAEKTLGGWRSIDDSAAMLMYLTADLAGQDEVARRWLKRSIDALRAGRTPLPTVAQWLAGERTPTEAELTDWSTTPAQKAIACAAIAAARPSLAATCGPVADRFNFRLAYPHELIAASRAKHRG